MGQIVCISESGLSARSQLVSDLRVHARQPFRLYASALAPTLTLCFGVAAGACRPAMTLRSPQRFRMGNTDGGQGRGTECLALSLRLHPGEEERWP